MRLSTLILSSLIILGGCGKKKAPEPAAPTGGAVGGFVDLDLGDDEDEFDEMMGSELMVATAQCGELVKLEPKAMMGKLGDGEIRCLDGKLREAEKQTTMDKISRVLMADAWAKGDKHRWEAVVRRHLEEIDMSDPDLCYKFAKHLVSNGTPDQSDEVIRWAGVALENKGQWVGDTHVKRVYNLYKIKALAAQNKWQYFEGKYLEKPDEAINKARTGARNDLKTFSREWLEYARSAEQDVTMARQLCVSAAGTEEFCD